LLLPLILNLAHILVVWLTLYPAGAPVDRIGFVEYAYDAAGRVARVTARERRFASGTSDPPGRVITENAYSYSARGDLLTEAQALGEAVQPSTPEIQYTWHYDPTDPVLSPASASGTGRHRLAHVWYPSHPSTGASRRAVTFAYGAEGSVDQALSRPASMSSTGAPAFATPNSLRSRTRACRGGRRWPWRTGRCGRD